MIDVFSGQKINIKVKCHIHGFHGKCENNADKYIFGTCLCDNHYYLISGQFAKNNVISKDKTRSKNDKERMVERKSI